MAKCPKDGTQIDVDYGMAACPTCGVILFIDMDGEAQIGSQVSSSQAEVPEAEPSLDEARDDQSPFLSSGTKVGEEIPALGQTREFSLEDLQSSMEEVGPSSFASESEYASPLDGFDVPSPEPAADSLAMLGETEPESEQRTLMAEPGPAGDGDESEAAPMEASEDQGHELDMDALLGYREPPADETQDQGSPGDPLGLNEYANSEFSQAKDGPFLFRLKISGIDSKEIRESLREAFTDSRFAWDADEVLRGIVKGELTIQNVSPVKATIVINRIKRLPVRIRWEQYAVTQTDPT